MPISALSPITQGIFVRRQDRRKRTLIVSGTATKSEQLLAGVLIAWLGCASQIPARAQETPRSNWTSTEAPCAKYNEVRESDLGNIGVKIDATEPWSKGFRGALRFWNTVLAANFHEETNLDSCAIRIINGGPDLLNNATVARSQRTEWDKFRGKIAVNPGAAGLMSSAEIYGVAVHELGHMLGLKHNPSSQSIMYFLNVNGTEILDRKDIFDLSRRHKIRAAVGQTGIVSKLAEPPIQMSQ
jgi:hypothetical protein